MNKTRYRSAAHQPHSEDGRITVLLIGLVTVALLAVAVGVIITSVHLQQRALLSCADRISAAGAAVLSAENYYGEGGAELAVPSESGARQEAFRTLERLSTTTCAVGQGVDITDLRVGENVIQVTVRTHATLPLLPPVLQGVAAPTMTQSSSARTV